MNLMVVMKKRMRRPKSFLQSLWMQLVYRIQLLLVKSVVEQSTKTLLKSILLYGHVHKRQKP